MNLDRRIGITGLIVALIAIAAFYLWPDKKWIGWTSLAVACVLGFVWLLMETFGEGSKEKVSAPLQAIGAVNISPVISTVVSPVISPHQSNIAPKYHEPAPAAPVKKPNLRCRRIYAKRIWVGHEMFGHNLDAIVAEIGNEISEGFGKSGGIKAHVTYMKNEEVLQTICPCLWEGEGNLAYLGIGESANSILAVNRGWWFSREYDGVDITSCNKIQIQILDENGPLLGNPFVVRCDFAKHWQPPTLRLE